MTKKKLTKAMYVDRDVSWMYFNHRILQESRKEYVPLLERISFLGIYSNNLDEFFRVRVASLNRILESDDATPKMRQEVKKALKTITKLNEQYSHEYSEATQQVMRELELHNIRLLNDKQLNGEQQAWLRDFYYDRLNGDTNPIWVSEMKDFSVLEDNRIYLLVEMTEKDAKKPKYAIIKVPDKNHGRFVKIPRSEGFDNLMYLDDVIRFCLPLIFSGFKKSTYRAYSFKFTKDAEMEVDNDADYSTMERIAHGVSSRKRGEPIRVVYDRSMPRDMQKKVMQKLKIRDNDTTLGSECYQNHKDLMNFPDCGHLELRYPQWKQVMKPEFLSSRSLLDLIREKDRFIHVPYHSFNGYIRLLREAALKPEVKEIKTTLYRLAKDSKVVEALICAARNGKKVTAVVELLARFDEESNIMWSKRMQEEGINVVFGVEGLKIHSKLLYIKDKKGSVACVGTGNFHESNAKVYTDYLMMTARPSIVTEVAKVFQFIERPFQQVRFNQLLVSPNSMKRRILRMLDIEIKNAKEGKEAWLKMKINHITDYEMVAKLYEASQAGVTVDILLRGNCSLVPGVPGLSDNIRAVGIIDRYLEHSRILIFCNGGRNKYYLGSADWMPRNLLSRIEVMTPVYDDELKADLMNTVETGLADTTNGRIIDGNGGNQLQEGEPLRSQAELYEYYANQYPATAPTE
ncbi:RNA degradosome polyphosphate kinase [Prevotella sp. kh1p2]|uniref:RNA degradosome polyphosphate kinase n=1 Tax=Prevotella sp. kh1p2 TaxID=1761883 RepID=UPI000B87DDFD|nr:RNA degradosome polyphosphate kinase [Prevotella sp. kh1p2]